MGMKRIDKVAEILRCMIPNERTFNRLQEFIRLRPTVVGDGIWAKALEVRRKLDLYKELAVDVDLDRLGDEPPYKRQRRQ